MDYNEFNSTPHIVETYVNGTSWYRVYSDGWCEQGGHNTNPAISNINLLKSYNDTNYTIVLTGDFVLSPSVQVTKVGTITSSSFSIVNSNSSYACYWYACGYIA